MTNAYKSAKIQDILSFFDNADLDKLDNYYKLMGIKFSDIFGMELQMFKEGLKDPSIRNHFKNMMNMSKDPSYLEMCLKDPKIQDVIKNNPLIKLNMQNPQLILNPQILQMNQNIFKKNESNQDENSNSEIFKPPEPFGNLNNNQFNQKTNSSHQILNNLNLCEDILNFFSNNKIDTNTCKQFQSQDFLSFFDNIDLDKLSTFYKSMGLKFSDIFGVEAPEFKELLKDPSFRSCMKNMKNMLKDPSFREMLLKDPNKQAIFKKYPIMELAFHNPELALNPQYIHLLENIFKKNESNPNENSISKNLVPPDPFGSLNNSQINQVMKPSDQIQNFNSVNNISNEIGIDYKEKYKEELSKLKNMGFNNEEASIQALKEFNGNVENAINKLLEQNN